MPVVHALLQAREDLEREVPELNAEELWTRPGGAAAIGFHIRHLGGTIDRLLTYADGRALSANQLRALKSEGEPGDPPASTDRLLPDALAQIDGALTTLRGVRGDELLAAREVGRAKLPSTVLGLFFHVGEHTTRHVGQLITTKKVVRGVGSGGSI